MATTTVHRPRPSGSQGGLYEFNRGGFIQSWTEEPGLVWWCTFRFFFQLLKSWSNKWHWINSTILAFPELCLSSLWWHPPWVGRTLLCESDRSPGLWWPCGVNAHQWGKPDSGADQSKCHSGAEWPPLWAIPVQPRGQWAKTMGSTHTASYGNARGTDNNSGATHSWSKLWKACI